MYRFVPSGVSALAAAALQVSGYQNPSLALALLGLALLLAAGGLFSYVRRDRPVAVADLPKSSERATRLRIEPPVSRVHRRQLQEIGIALARAVQHDQSASPSNPGDLWGSFRRHFPVESQAVDAWDALASDVATARAELQAWIRTAGAPLFAKAEAIPGRSEALIAGGVEAAITGRLAGEPEHLFLGGFATARVAPNIDQQQTKQWYEAFLAEALQTPEAMALERLRRELRDAKGALLPELQRIGALHIIRGECDLCE